MANELAILNTLDEIDINNVQFTEGGLSNSPAKVTEKHRKIAGGMLEIVKQMMAGKSYELISPVQFNYKGNISVTFNLKMLDSGEEVSLEINEHRVRGYRFEVFGNTEVPEEYILGEKVDDQPLTIFDINEAALIGKYIELKTKRDEFAAKNMAIMEARAAGQDTPEQDAAERAIELEAEALAPLHDEYDNVKELMESLRQSLANFEGSIDNPDSSALNRNDLIYCLDSDGEFRVLGRFNDLYVISKYIDPEVIASYDNIHNLVAEQLAKAYDLLGINQVEQEAVKEKLLELIKEDEVYNNLQEDFDVTKRIGPIDRLLHTTTLLCGSLEFMKSVRKPGEQNFDKSASAEDMMTMFTNAFSALGRN